MKYGDFRKKVETYPFFRSNFFIHLTDDVATLRCQVSQWQKQGYVYALKRGVYALRDEDRKVNFSRFFLANSLYTPSYISLESALSFYGIIPEKVEYITSISTKKTQRFANKFGVFAYRHIDPHAYDGFTSLQDEFGQYYQMAIKEKALIDYFYFKCRELKEFDETVFNNSFRFQNLRGINKKLLLHFAAMFDKKKLDKMVKAFVVYMEKSGA